MWQSTFSCVSFDPDLIYVPTEGRCYFKNIEFDTVLTFDKWGRKYSNREHYHNHLIATIGDSFTMGWGVNDDETFSAVLSELIKRPVINLGVSSYGTYRELKRLVNNPMFSNIETIILQYCDNDLQENLLLNSPPQQTPKERFQSMFPERKPYSINYRSVLHALHNMANFNILGIGNSLFQNTKIQKHNTETYLNFTPHLKGLVKVLGLFPQIKNKKLIIFYINSKSWEENKFYNFVTLVSEAFPKATVLDVSFRVDDYFLLDDHLNKAGHHFLATELQKALLEKK
ncbi:MAG: SGNH/GDSL hydrolase family protein [Bdellovibrionales bacterium]|nr:SGNH/GDSL hydrolase family protein [Bdellovibrionales bacterium]